MSASSDQVASRVTCPSLRSDEAEAADALAASLIGSVKTETETKMAFVRRA
jgi:hypothetical protein